MHPAHALSPLITSADMSMQFHENGTLGIKQLFSKEVLELLSTMLPAGESIHD